MSLAYRRKRAVTPGSYQFENSDISLTASVGGSLPPEGALFSVTGASQSVTQGADGASRKVLLGYKLSFHSELGRAWPPARR